MRGEGSAGDFVDGGSIGPCARRDSPAQLRAPSVGHAVIYGDIVRVGRLGGIGLKIRDAMGEGRGGGEPCGDRVIFHVVLKGMGEYDRGADAADDRGDLPE